ncbi:MAG: non-hydrolyzing UDP-N-acetylglucosamine 2-epimerase [Polyangia bacterium]
MVGARPNYMKVAAVMRAAGRTPGIRQVLVHTGQHYDAAMNDVFFADLGLPEPDHHLGVGSGSQAEQTAKVMLHFEPVLKNERPDRVVVVGDVNSTVAAAMVAVKEGVPVDHVEAGLRSFDRGMPEEVNRIVTDAIADELYTHSPEAREHLRREGRAEESIHFVGNVMIDALDQHLAAARGRRAIEALGLSPRGYALATLHRPSNVDAPAMLAELIEILGEVARALPVVFPLHPRTRARIEAAEREGLRLPEGLLLSPPRGYLDFLQLLDGARVVLTDSGGVQEETTALGVPCLTLRENTERPITCLVGSNVLVGRDRTRIARELERALAGPERRGERPPLWDGHAAERIVAVWAGRL